MTQVPEKAGEVEVPEGITGDTKAATIRRVSAYERWFYICTCGHAPESHDFPEGDGVFASGAPCRVRDCSCEGYDHISGKPDHPLNPLQDDDPRAPYIVARERERLEEAERRVRWLLDRLDRLDRFADELDARGRANRDAADLRSILKDARTHLDDPDTDVGVNARLDSIRQQAAQQERDRIKELAGAGAEAWTGIEEALARFGEGGLDEADLTVRLRAAQSCLLAHTRALTTLEKEDH